MSHHVPVCSPPPPPPPLDISVTLSGRQEVRPSESLMLRAALEGPGWDLSAATHFSWSAQAGEEPPVGLDEHAVGAFALIPAGLLPDGLCTFKVRFAASWPQPAPCLPPPLEPALAR